MSLLPGARPASRETPEPRLAVEVLMLCEDLVFAGALFVDVPLGAGLQIERAACLN